MVKVKKSIFNIVYYVNKYYKKSKLYKKRKQQLDKNYFKCNNNYIFCNDIITGLDNYNNTGHDLYMCKTNSIKTANSIYSDDNDDMSTGLNNSILNNSILNNTTKNNDLKENLQLSPKNRIFKKTSKQLSPKHRIFKKTSKQLSPKHRILKKHHNNYHPKIEF